MTRFLDASVSTRTANHGWLYYTAACGSIDSGAEGGNMNYRVIIIIFTLFTVISVAMIFYTKTRQEDAIISSGLQSARIYSNAINSFRTIYSSKVVAIAKQNGLPTTHDLNNKNAIPLPVTLTILLGNKIGESGSGEKVSLYSPYPFHWRQKTGGLKDDFSKQAWVHFSKNKTIPYFRVFTQNKTKYIRYATADIMGPSCVDCHNSHVDSPKTDWKAGDVRAIVDVRIPLNNIVSSAENDLTLTIAAYTILAILSLLGILFEISKHKNASKKLENAIKTRTFELEEERSKAVEVNNAKTEFLSRMSHELRTPMNAVLGFSQLLKLDAKTEIEERNCDEIIDAGNHLLSLINEVLDLSQIESGNVEVEIKTIDIDNIVDESLKLITPLSEEKGISIEGYITTGLTVYADKTRLKQVLLNLISNAIKYNVKNGSIKVSVVLKQPGTIRMNITDTGIGLNEEQLDKLFLPFERLGAENTNIDGVGIGLTISKRLVELMDGKIGVINTQNGGCTFWVELKCVEN